MQPECRQHPTAQPEGLSKDYSARYSRGMLTLSNYGPYKPCNPWHLSAGLVMICITVLICKPFQLHHLNKNGSVLRYSPQLFPLELR